MTPRLKEKFKTTVTPSIIKQFGIANPMAAPRLEKIIITVGLGREIEGTKIRPSAKEQVLKDLTVISGQKPVMTVAKKSVANFKVRAGYENGVRVTMRGDRMWEFFDRLISIAIPRIKDFRGLSDKSFDGRGNYSFGVTEQGIFPEVDMANASYAHGMNFTFVFRNSTNEQSLAALKEMGVPFNRPDDN